MSSKLFSLTPEIKYKCINYYATNFSGLGGQLKYSIISGNVRLGFAIHQDTGLITVNSALDQETT